MANIINAGTNGVTVTGAASAVLNIQVGGTNALQIGTGATLTLSTPQVFPAGTAAAPSITTTGDVDTGMYFPAANQAAISAGGTVAAAFNSNGLFFRNRIINGDMRIDQRNAGAAVTADSSFPVDRWFLGNGTSGVVSVQQSTSVVPTGFTQSVGYTVTTADASIGATDFLIHVQWIEGNNIADLSFGTANARPVTISFWVRSSVTGTYCVVIGNSTSGTGAPNRSYVAEYTISAANTWEYKTITIAGDTSGTWNTSTLRGMILRFGLTAGANFQQAAGSWGTGNAVGSSNQTALISTLNATWYVTGVQLETGSVATPFERRPYGTELMLCQRYYEKSYQQSIKPGTVSNLGGVQFPVVTAIPNGYQVGQSVTFIVTKRAAPTVTNYSYNGNTSRLTYSGGTDAGAGSATPNLIGEYSFQTVNSSGADVAITSGALYFFTASAEL